MHTHTPPVALPVHTAPIGGAAPRSLLSAAAIGAAVCLATGCCSLPRSPLDTRELISPQRLDHGYALLLPGIMGCTSTDHELTVGLAEADLTLAIEMYDWTEGPRLLISNLRGLDRNRREARKIAAKIVDYQDRYPGRPVYLVGYSGGAGMAVMALEALPSDREVTSAILLAATLAPDYDLRSAISHTQQGIRHFYSPVDVPVLMGAMAAVGTMEGRHTVAAGAWGFVVPKGLSQEQRRQYQRGLTQQSYSLDMLAYGHTGGHFGWAHPAFVRHYLAPLVTPPDTPTVQTVSYEPRGESSP